jgi:hypothetical protein
MNSGAAANVARAARSGALVQIKVSRKMLVAGMAVLDQCEDVAIATDALVFEVFSAMVQVHESGAIEIVGREPYL